MKRILMLPAASILVALSSTPARAWDGFGSSSWRASHGNR